jgi:hypothetical protein
MCSTVRLRCVSLVYVSEVPRSLLQQLELERLVVWLLCLWSTGVASYIYTAATGLREWYAGRVVGYDMRKKWYRIRYDDGDGAELTKTEVVKGQKDYMLHFVANGVAREEQ